MVTLKEACELIMQNNPGQYIHFVREYGSFYDFCLLQEGTVIRQYSLIPYTSIIQKSDGSMEERVILTDKRFKERYVGHSSEEILAILKES